MPRVTFFLLHPFPVQSVSNGKKITEHLLFQHRIKRLNYELDLTESESVCSGFSRMGKSWEISIHAKGGSRFRFRFRFKAKLAETRTKFHRFPFLSKLHKLLINPKTTASKPKFLDGSNRHPSSRSKHDAIALKKASIPKNPEAKLALSRQGKTSTDKDANNLGNLIVRSVESLSQSIHQRNTRGVLAHGSSVALFAFLLLIERFSSSSKARSLVAAIVVAVVAVVAAIGVGSDGHGNVWRAWRFAASSGSVDELSQAIFYRVWEFLGL